MEPLQHQKLCFDQFTLDLTRGCLLRGEEGIKLRPKSFEVLKYLVSRAGTLVSKDELIGAVWPDTAVTDDSLVQCLIEVRRALGNGGQHIVKTIPRRGYIFDAKVANHTATDVVVVTHEVEGVKFAIEENSARGHGLVRRSGMTVPMALAAAIVITALTLTIYRYRNSRAESSIAPIRSIAVLPLKNLSDDPSNQYFSDGMTESLISALAQFHDLKVISHGSVARFKGKEVDPQEVGNQLGVAAVLEGSVRKSAESVRVAVRLVNVSDGRVLWARDTQERALTDLFALQDEIARSAASGLRLELGEKGKGLLIKRYTDNVEAYQLYLKGRYHVVERYTPDQVKRGLDYFNKAIAIDPNYALAYAGLADAYYGFSSAYLSASDAMPKARAAAQKALRLDETLAEAHVSLGLVKMYYDWDFAGAEKEFRRALELQPDDALARNWYSWYLLFTGQPDQAISEIRRAEEIDPLSLKMKRDLGRVLFYARRYDEAIEQYQRALKLEPNDPLTHWCLGITHAMKRSFPEAFAEFQKAMSLDDDPFRLGWLGYTYSMSGQRAEARKLIDQLEREKRYVSPYTKALVYAAMGERDQAFQLLEQDLQERNEQLIWSKVDPVIDPVRSDPRFADLMRRVGLPGA